MNRYAPWRRDYATGAARLLVGLLLVWAAWRASAWFVVATGVLLILMGRANVARGGVSGERQGGGSAGCRRTTPGGLLEGCRPCVGSVPIWRCRRLATFIRHDMGDRDQSPEGGGRALGAVGLAQSAGTQGTGTSAQVWAMGPSSAGGLVPVGATAEQRHGGRGSRGLRSGEGSTAPGRDRWPMSIDCGAYP